MGIFITASMAVISTLLPPLSLIRNPTKPLRCIYIFLNIFVCLEASYIAFENYKSETVQRNSLELLVSATKSTNSSRLILEKAMIEACKNTKWTLKTMSSLKTDGTTSYFFYKKNAPTEDPTGLLILSGGDIAKLSTKKRYC